MPVQKNESSAAPVHYPNSDYALVKYMDITKFISILQRRALFFCRIDKLEDKFEGTAAKSSFEGRIKWHEETNHLMTQPFSHSQIVEEVKRLYEFDNKLRALFCVCCWNKFDTESAALWKIYSAFNSGIMIKSSVSRLINSFESTEQSIQISEIRYLNYDRDRMPDGNSNYPLIHKQKAYGFEQEVRLIYGIVPNEGWEHDWQAEEVEEGVYLNSNLNVLIDEVVVGPYAPKWFFKIIEDLMRKYNLQKSVRISVLTPPDKIC